MVFKGIHITKDQAAELLAKILNTLKFTALIYENELYTPGKQYIAVGSPVEFQEFADYFNAHAELFTQLDGSDIEQDLVSAYRAVVQSTQEIPDGALNNVVFVQNHNSIVLLLGMTDPNGGSNAQIKKQYIYMY